jgi:hypothetical protein
MLIAIKNREDAPRIRIDTICEGGQKKRIRKYITKSEKRSRAIPNNVSTIMPISFPGSILLVKAAI